MSRVFANGLEDWGSIPGRVIPKTQKMVLDAVLFNTQHYKIRIKSEVEQSREWSSALPYTSVLELLKREPLGHSRLRSPTLFIYIYIYLGSNISSTKSGVNIHIRKVWTAFNRFSIIWKSGYSDKKTFFF